jgi:CheY-like chemotaxis protein
VTDHALEGDPKIHRLQPLRIVLSGRDRRYLRVTSFLLSQHGYNVLETSPRKTIDAVERHRPEVVLLESNDSRGIAARKVAALQALAAAPSVLVVTDDDEDERWEGLAAVKKWTPIGDLTKEIESAARRRPAPLLDGGRAYS